MRRHLRSRNPVAKATRRSKRETRKSPRRASTLPRPGRGRPPKRGFWSCRFEPLEDRFLLSVAPGVDNTLSSSDDALFLPVGSAGSYAEESQWVSNSAPVGVFTGGAESQTAVFDFSFDGTPILQDVAGGAIVTLAGEESWVSTGDPVMPVRESTILLPVGMEITSIDVTYLDTGTVIADGVELLAAPAALPFSEGGVEAINDWTTLVNTSFHEQDAVLYSNYTISGYHVGTLRIFPMEYDAAAGTLSYHTEVSVTVTVGAAEDGGNVSVRGSEADHLRVAALVDNPEALSDYPLPAATAGGESPMLPAAGQYDYVIVTSSALEASFQPLVNQKIARGLTATTVSTETIYANYSGTETGDNADRIRHFITDAYANWGTQWVLLGGDAEVLPQRAVYASVGSTVDTALPTDLYYAALDGTWNGDGDNLWGESNDGTGGGDIDLVPEVYIGRAPVSNTTEAGNFVSKTIRYETTPHANATTAVWLGEQLDSGTWGSYSAIPIRDQSIPDDWNLIERYDSAGGWTGSDFIGDLNASPHLVTHLGHSNETYNARLVNSYVAGLTNVDPYLMYSQGCYSGAFDTHNISIAEQHVVDDHGAFGVVMNTRYGWYMPGSTPGASHYYAREFWDAAFNEGHSHLGEVAQDAKDDNMFRVGSTGVYRWIHFTSTLFGDPETPLQIGGGPSAGGEIHGAVAEDANADGQRQVGETGLAGHTVFLDLDDDGARDVGTVTTALTGAPVNLVDNGTLTSTIVVSGAALVTDLNVSLDITHTYDGDLEVYLISPSGTKVELFTAVGGWGDNFTGTTLDDEAASPISGAAAPFTGTFRPEGLLSTFDGENANGAWTLEITDTASWDTGTLNNWSLEIAVEEPHTLTGADGTYAFLGLADGTYSVRYELPGGWSHTGPVDGLHSVAATGGGIVTGVDFLAVNNPPAIDLGAVDFHEIEALDLTGGDSWYSLQTTRQGYLTLEALYEGLPGDVEMKLYDEGLSELATSAVSDGGERIDWTVGAGQTYYLSLTGGAADVDLRLANLVHWDGASVFVYGTAADDRLDFAAAAWHQVTINGVHYEFDASVVNSVRFDGGAGRDTAVLLGSSGDDTAVLHPSWAALTGPGYRAVVTDTADIIVMGQGGTDVAKLYDSAGDDTFVATTAYARLFGDGFYNQAFAFRYVHAYATGGGTDVAKLYDSAGDDTFVATPRYGSLYGDGFYNRAVSFRYVHAFATGGGTDVAKLYDSAGDDTFVATPRDGSLYGDGFYNRAVSFRYVHAFASEGNSDVAKLYDDPGTADIFIADRHSSRLYGEGFYNRAKGFRYVHAFSSGGDDVATLHDDPTGDDTFLATARDCRLVAALFFCRVLGFAEVDVFATGGYDRANLRDSEGDDHFRAGAGLAELTMPSCRVRAHDFAHVRAASGHGGIDVKYLKATDYVLETVGDWAVAIASDGEPFAHIVLPADSTPTEEFAAAELQRYLLRISDAEVPIVGEGEGGEGPRVLIGRTAIGEQALNELVSDDTDAFLVKRTGDALVLAGRSQRATLYAVYDFLEDDLGCRWLAPGPDWEEIPALSTIAISEVDRAESPAMDYRFLRLTMGGEPGSWEEACLDWAVKQKINVGRWWPTELPEASAIRGGFRGWMSPHLMIPSLLPPSVYFEDHAEWYALVDGERRAFGDQTTQLCTTNPEVVEMVAQGIGEVFDTWPEIEFVPLVSADTPAFCECEQCTALDTGDVWHWEPFNQDLPVVTERWLSFVNAVARRLQTTHPGKKVYTLAYHDTFRPPDPAVIRPEPNVMIQVVNSPRGYVCFVHGLEHQDCPKHAEFRRALDDWVAMTPGGVLAYQYVPFSLFRSMPYPAAHKFVDDIKYLQGAGVIGYEGQNLPEVWGTYGVALYSIAKTMWDGQVEADSLVKDYCDNAFGEASEPMQQFIRTLEHGMETADHISDGIWSYMTPEVMAQARTHLDAAHELARSPTVVRRLRTIEIGFHCGELGIESWRMGQAGVANQDPDLLRQAIELGDAAVEYCRSEQEADPHYAASWRQLAALPYKWRRELASLP